MPSPAVLRSLPVSPSRSPVETFFARATTWRAELLALRAILLDCGLEESLKWGKPCYAIDGANVAILQPFQACLALMFFQGALLEDTHGLLRIQGANSRSAMRLEFDGTTSIRKTVVAAYVEQAVAVRRSGRTVAPAPEPDLPNELQQALTEDRALARAFAALTPGRRRSHALHVAGAKQAKTRAARAAACAPKILAGKGWNER